MNKYNIFMKVNHIQPLVKELILLAKQSHCSTVTFLVDQKLSGKNIRLLKLLSEQYDQYIEIIPQSEILEESFGCYQKDLILICTDTKDLWLKLASETMVDSSKKELSRKRKKKVKVWNY